MFRQNGPLEIEGKADGVPVPVTISGGGGVSHVIVDSGTLTAVTAITNPLPAGSNVLGHVIADSGSTTAVTGNVTVVQPTGTNLHTVVDSGSTAVTGNVTVVQPTGTNLHAVLDSGTTTVTQATGTNLHTVVDSGLIALSAQADVNLKQLGGNNQLSGGANGSQAVGGTVATNVAITQNPLNLGAQGVSSENAAVTTGRQVQLVADLNGKLIVLPYANSENFVSATTAAMSGTTSTVTLAAPASGLRNYVTTIIVANAHATVGTNLLLQDGSGGTTLGSIPAAALYGGAVVTFPVPLRQPTTATGFYVQNETTGSSVKATVIGYVGK